MSLRWLGSGRPRQVRALGAVLMASTAALCATSALGSSGASSPEPTAQVPEKPAARDAHVVRELTGLRTATSDTFLQSDGTRVVKVYPHTVNYQAASGGWTPIDDRLTRASDGSWQPAASPVPVSLPSSLAAGPVSVGPPDRALSFALQGAGSGEGAASANRRSYANALPGVSVSYTTTGDSVRETLSLASANAPTVYRYSLSLASGLHASLSSTGAVVVSDAQGKTAYTLAAPTVNDSSTTHHFAARAPVRYELSADGSTLSLVLDKSWLESPERVFPVKIDPDVFFTEEQDCSIVSGAEANKTLCGGPLYVGLEPATSEVGRALLHFNVSSIPRDSQILSSRMRLWFEEDTDTGGLEFDVRALTRGFTQTATWNTYDGTHNWTTAGGDFSSTVAGNRWVEEELENNYVSFGFTPLVEQWVQQPSSNYGVLLKAHNESETRYDTFAQSDDDVELEEPYMEVEYSPRLGVNEGDVVLGDELAAGGEVAVNAANGNLLVNSPDVNYEGEGYETKLTRYYNSQDEDMHRAAFGDGWSLSPGDNTLVYPSWWDGSYFFHEPGGGYARFDRNPAGDGHPNPGDLAFTTPLGLNATLIGHSNETRTLTFNETGTEWQFNNAEYGYPTEIAEPEGAGNKLTLSYGEYSGTTMLSSIADSHSDKLTLTRKPEDEDDVTKIEGADGKKWTYGYNSLEIASYEDPEKHKTTYAYTESGLLTELKDESGTYVISYDTSQPKRVTSLRRLVNGTVKEVGSEDEITSYEYKKPESPTCKPETDVAETVVSYKPTGEPEAFCFDANDHFTGPKSEEETLEEEPGEGEPPEVPAGTCNEDPELHKEDCALEEAPPETPEDLKTNHFGIADNNWLLPLTKAQKEAGVEHEHNFNYFTEAPPITALKAKNYRRTIPWNMVFEAERNSQHPGEDPGAQARLEDVEAWVTKVKSAGAEPYVSFDIECTYRKKTPHELTTWDDPRFNLTEQQEKVDDHPCTQAPNKAQYKAAVERFMKHSVLSGVRYFTALNEPNYAGKSQSEDKTQETQLKPTWSGTTNVPAEGEAVKGAFLAGEYWRALSDLCDNVKPEKCFVAAGEFADSEMPNAFEMSKSAASGYPYWHEYIEGMGSNPKAYRWAWHAYHDGEATIAAGRLHHPATWWTRFHRFEKAVDHFMKHAKYTHPEIWLTEQGVAYFRHEVQQHALWNQHNGLAKDMIDAFVQHQRASLINASPNGQITRFFYYSTRGAPNFDSGLLEAEQLPKNIARKYAKSQPRPEIYPIYKGKITGTHK